ncbi:SCO6745 family protein [Frondihabitans australicus]|uniref:SalK n=1 Tax=Frondihabitans australicus TaxID=386892 RepID=A0A495II50_9MICO|nr:hypothetical protein [Frondihabitans australicus]RKR75663.1 hypothetical protein C8E83_2811 [Frondihabitans australicus]
MTTREELTRSMWTLFEPIHALNYFSPEARQAFADAGLPRFWDGYFAGRAAPLGAVTAAPVIAMFSGFAPRFVERALPAVWGAVSPGEALEARMVGAEGALRRILRPAGTTDAEVERAADALAEVASRVTVTETIARPLAAANAALPVPDDPYRRLWQATSTLREHRGDGHVLVLASAGIAGLSTIVLRSAVDLDAASMRAARGWSDEQWAQERARLAETGLLRADHTVSPWGLAALARAEEATNRLALGPWAAMSDDEIVGVARLLSPIARACSVVYPRPNPIGLPLPWDPDGAE